MLNNPRLNPCYSIETIDTDKVFFLSEREEAIVSDRLSCSLAALIDGDRNNDEIIDALQLFLLSDEKMFKKSKTFFKEVLNVSVQAQYALLQMEQKGYLVQQDNSLSSELEIFCHHLNINPTLAHERLGSTKVAVKTFGSVSGSELISMLESMEIQVAEVGDLTVVLTDDYLNPELAEFNQQALKVQSPWMLVKPLGSILWIGPLFDPKKTGCWDCLAKRLRDNRPIEGFIQRNKDISTNLTPPLGFLPSTVQTALGMVATEVFKWIVLGENKRLENNLITYDAIASGTSEADRTGNAKSSSY